MSVLDLRGVQLTRNAKPYDLSLRAGEIVAVAGALGSGKSRLLGALFWFVTDCRRRNPSRDPFSVMSH